MTEHLAQVLSLWGFFAASSFVVWAISSSMRSNREARARAELQSRLLDRLTNNQELANFLQSEAGQKLWEMGSNGTAPPVKKILNSVQAGLVLTLVGGAMIILSSGRPPETAESLLIMGGIGLAMGIGFLLSATAAWFLSKSFGAMQHKDPLGR